MKSFTLGLDIGSNSLGWAMLNDEPNINGTNLIAGVRIFPDATDKKGNLEESRNLKRRAARLMRRQLDRRSRRKKKLKNLLQKEGLIPVDISSYDRWLDLDPYVLRKKALDTALTAEEFARVLIHLNQRRGFKSNLKEQGKAAKEEGEIKGAISNLQKQIDESGFRTLGEYLATEREKGNKIRETHTSRSMYEHEFELLWRTQADYHPDIWTEKLKERIREAIFFQRPLKPQDRFIGKCDLEPEEKRCQRASWFAQQFRVLQELNDLRILTKREGEPFLTAQQRETLLAALMKQKEIKVSKIKEKILGLSEIEALNYERTGRTKMQGNPVEAGLRKIFKKEFEEKAEWLRETVWESLLNEEADDFRRKALSEWNLSEEQIDALYKIPRPQGYFHYSLKAIKNLLPYLDEGCDLPSAIDNAGYQKTENERQGYLPPVHADDFRNPVVVRALSETRKVVNAIVREYGSPSKIVIELARETKGSIASRMESLRKSRQMASVHKRIAGELEKMSVPANHDTIEKYKLWEECGKVCPYTGQPIGLHQLYGESSEFEVEHILPYSLSLDDSFLNKTLCARSENRAKHNRTPYEAYHHDKARYDQILLRVKRLPYEKRRRFSIKEIPDDFTRRQLNDTSYASKAVRLYLARLGIRVRATKGGVTARLRRAWGLNNLLGASDGKKTHDDHRHHAVDALVVALTTPAHVKALGREFIRPENKKPPSPWEEKGIPQESFRRIAAGTVQGINVSHRANRKVAGQLNEETNYGRTTQENSYVTRVFLRALTPSMAARIVDPTVRRVVGERLSAHGIEIGKGSSPVPQEVFKEELCLPGRNRRKGSIIKKVRVKKTLGNAIPIRDSKGEVYRYVNPGNNHHITIFEYTNEKGSIRRCNEVVSRFEAARRALNKEPVVSKVHPEQPQARFLMSLAENDMVIAPDSEGKERLCRIQKFSAGNTKESVDIFLRLHNAATIEDKETNIRLRSLAKDKFKVKKVSVDILGRIHPCHD